MLRHLALLCTATVLPAGTLIELPQVDLSGLAVVNYQSLTQSFTLGQTYTNVAWSGWFRSWTDNQQYTLNAYLTSSVGPGTLGPALATASVTDITAAGQVNFHTIFSGLTLGPGTYHVTFTSPNVGAQAGALWSFAGPSNLHTFAPGTSTADPGVCIALGNCTIQPFAPASTYTTSPNSLLAFRLTGDAVPEPATTGLVAVALLAFGIARRRRT